MCYRTEITKNLEALERRFKAQTVNSQNLILGQEIYGFDFQPTPIIINAEPQFIQGDFHWGLIPSWSQDDSIRKLTLNAKIETLEEKPAYRDVVKNRCLIIATGYYEWRWNDEKGKSKQKYGIYSAESEIFAFAGIYAKWKNPVNGQWVNSYSIVTTEANEKMQYIHNTKKRMPIVLKLQDESSWLNNEIPIKEFAFPHYNPNLIAFPA